ncbi:Glutamate receptor ionotropic, kainate 3 [Trichinella papuae]|uniref:Glutamate receptor ionotropic, kainate 3 n=1 Tax=Trichinella papuae TaxID=268474 RepID=A0A0V1N0V6_9BILA|nr:Glutamate receptor ionotropic, kainate 3 [Trichinella papuae]
MKLNFLLLITFVLFGLKEIDTVNSCRIGIFKSKENETQWSVLIFREMMHYLMSNAELSIIDIDSDNNYEREKMDFVITITHNSSIINSAVLEESNKIPHLKIYTKFWDMDERNLEYFEPSIYSLIFTSPLNVLVAALMDLINFMDSTAVYILYDNKYKDFFKNEAIWKAKINKPITIQMVGQCEEKIHKQISNLLSNLNGSANFYVFGNTTFLQTYFLHIEQFMKHSSSKWTAISTDTLPYSNSDSYLSLLFLRPKNVQSLNAVDNFLIWIEKSDHLKSLKNNIDEIEIAFYYDIASLSFLYLNQTSQNSCTTDGKVKSISVKKEILEAVKEMSAKSAFGVYELFKNMAFQMVTLNLYRIREGPDFSRQHLIGNWSSNNKITLFYKSGLSEDIISQNHYRVQPPFIEKYEDENGNWSLRGYCIDLLEMMKEELNFSYELYEAPDKLYGWPNELGRWNGIMNNILQGDADFALASMTVTASRELVIDFTFPHFDLSGYAILLKRGESDESFFKFLTVLELPVWLCTIGSFLFTSFLLWLFDRFSPYSYKNNKEKYINGPEKREFTFKESLWFCMNSLTPQGGGETPRNFSGRIVAATWWLFGFIIIASYTANLAAFLTVSRIESSITSIDQLAKQYKIKYGVVKDSLAAAYFQRMAEIEQRFYDTWKTMSLNESMNALERIHLAVWDYPVSDHFTNMWRYMQETGLPNNLEEGIEWVLASKSINDGYALIAEASFLRYIEITDCRLQVVGEEFSRRPYALAVQQGSPLKDQFSSLILKLLNQRKLEILKEKWWKNNPRKMNCPNHESESKGISVTNLGGVFIVILIGIFFSLISLLFEYAYFKRKQKRCFPVTTSETDTSKNGDVHMLHYTKQS